MKNKETLEEAAERAYSCGLFSTKTAFIAGAKWQQEQDKNKYSEEEVLELLNNLRLDSYNNGMGRIEFLEWFEEFKKK
jgi:hypothetical protein